MKSPEKEAHTGLMFLASMDLINNIPRTPPMAPPAPWMPEKTKMPSKAEVRKLGFMKNMPIMMPAVAVAATEVRLVVPVPSFRSQGYSCIQLPR